MRNFKQLALWGQARSRNQGNLLVIPIADSLLYVELFLQATGNQCGAETDYRRLWR